jgi:hypothetical protein
MSHHQPQSPESGAYKRNDEHSKLFSSLSAELMQNATAFGFPFGLFLWVEVYCGFVLVGVFCQLQLVLVCIPWIVICVTKYKLIMQRSSGGMCVVVIDCVGKNDV